MCSGGASPRRPLRPWRSHSLTAQLSPQLRTANTLSITTLAPSNDHPHAGFTHEPLPETAVTFLQRSSKLLQGKTKTWSPVRLCRPSRTGDGRDAARALRARRLTQTWASQNLNFAGLRVLTYFPCCVVVGGVFIICSSPQAPSTRAASTVVSRR